MYGLFKEKTTCIQIHNMIFEARIYNYLISKRETSTKNKINYETKNQFIDEFGDLKIQLLLEKFQELMKEEYRNETEKFLEKEGRLIFLAFIKPIINSVGYYFVEPQTRTNKRIDIVITYNKKLYIIELKIWYGEKYEEQGLTQLAEYLKIKNSSKGYIVIFNFNKNKEYSRNWRQIGDKEIYEVTV